MIAKFLTPAFTPMLLTVLREGYRGKDFRADVLAGLTVAIVALPLSMAIAIASGVSPDRGLYTSIVGGFLVSALGGSRYQIGGPAGAYIVLVLATVQTFGVDGMVLATFMGGLILLLIGLLGLGAFIRFIPYPVTIGFTAGIAVIIFASQVKDLLGLTLAGPEPGALLPKLQVLGAALGSFNPAAFVVAVLSVGIIVVLRRYRPRWPAYLIAVAVAAGVVSGLGLPVATIGSRFGGIPHALPAPHLPDLSAGRMLELLPAALAFAFLGGIESLLSAVVADGMSGQRHRSSGELAAQGIANVASALFGGICVTGTIARTATNVRAGAHGPVSGMLHALFLLLFMLVAAPLASFIPLPALAALLAVVCWAMAEQHQFVMLIRASPGDALVMLATFLTVVFRDLTEGILLGFTIGTLMFLHRMSKAIEVESPAAAPFGAGLATNSEIVVFRVSGAFFFGAAATVGLALDSLPDHPKCYVIDLAEAPVMDSTAGATLRAFVDKARARGAAVVIGGASKGTRAVLRANGVERTGTQFAPSLADAMILAHASVEKPRIAGRTA